MNKTFNAYLDAYRKYVTFNGRATRYEFFGFWVIHLIILTLSTSFIILIQLGFIAWVFAQFYLIISFIPAIAVTVRRLHDTNRSGWWALPIITGIGIIIPFYFAFQEGQGGANKYGINPKPGSSARTF